jgi:hypothetical protein
VDIGLLGRAGGRRLQGIGGLGCSPGRCEHERTPSSAPPRQIACNLASIDPPG